MAFTDKLKKIAADYDLAGKAEQAKSKAAELAEQNREKIAGAVDKAGQTANAKTNGKYSEHISKAQGAALKGVDKVAEQGGTSAAVGGESPVERAIGADATTTGLDPHN